MGKIQQPGEQSSARIHVMPGEFFGGKDPVIEYKKQPVVVVEKALPPLIVPPIVEKKSEYVPPANPPKSSQPGGKRWKIIGASLALLVVIAGVSAYYMWQAGYFKPSLPLTPPPPVFESLPPPLIVETTTTPPLVESPTTTIDITSLPIDFPTIMPRDSADVDADSLTDAEEESFGTDSGAYDSDQDGYFDGLEVFNLYNPGGQAPMLLIDSGAVAEYVNGTHRYRLYYPVNWNIAAVDPAGDQTLISAITGDFIEIRAVKKNQDEQFIDWFARLAPGQSFTDLTTSTNRFLIPVWKRADDAVAYVESATHVFVILYHPFETSATPFRHIMQMISQSFRPSQTSVQVPLQPVTPTTTKDNAGGTSTSSYDSLRDI